MAAEGSEQQREQTILELVQQRKTLEKELQDILNKRLELQTKYGNIDATLTAQMQESYQKSEEHAHNMLNIQKEIEIQTTNSFTATIENRQAIQATIQQNERLLRDEFIRASVLKIQQMLFQQQLNAMQAQHDVLQSQTDHFVGFLGKFGTIFNIQKKYNSGLKQMNLGAEKHRMIWASLLTLVEASFATFLKIDEGLAKFRMYMGFLRPDMERLKNDMLAIATELARVGVNIEGVTAATIALGNEFGSVRVISKDLIETTALLKAQLGVAEESSAGFLRNIAAISRTTAQTQRHMAFVANELTSAAGVPLNLVMQDVAKMSGNALALVSKMPLQIVKTAVEARKMGTTLNKMADASANILNFTESVQAEMEASVLVGRAVNLQLARELAYRGKIVESTQAIIAEAKRINFENLDYFQMQAFAAASGRSTDELLKMIQAQRQLSEARNMDELKDEVALIDRLSASRHASLKDSVLQREMSIKQMANQERMLALQQQWNELIMEVSRVMYPVFDFLLKIAIIAVKLLPVLAGGAKFLAGAFRGVEKVLLGIGAMFIWLSKSSWLTTLGMQIGSLSKVFKSIGGFFNKLFSFSGFISKFSFVAPFLRAIPVIGWIIAGFQFVYRLLQRFREVDFVKGDWIGNIWKGIKAIGLALFDVLLKPFKDVFDWIMKWVGGHSPSYIGLSIVKGIASVGGMLLKALISPWKQFSASGILFKVFVEPFSAVLKWLGKFFLGHSPSGIGLSIVKGIASVGAQLFDALTWPWRKFLSWVLEKIPFMGGIAKKISGGVTGAMQDAGVVNGKTTVVTNARIAETPETAAAAAKTTEAQAKQDQDSVTLGEILKGIRDLNNNLVSGKIGIYIDGQLMSATLARQTSFIGGYGTNRG